MTSGVCYRNGILVRYSNDIWDCYRNDILGSIHFLLEKESDKEKILLL
jgi:hypothetical protein